MSNIISQSFLGRGKLRYLESSSSFLCAKAICRTFAENKTFCNFAAAFEIFEFSLKAREAVKPILNVFSMVEASDKPATSFSNQMKTLASASKGLVENLCSNFP